MASTWETVTVDDAGGKPLSYLCAGDGERFDRAIVCLPDLAGSAEDCPVPVGFPSGTAFVFLPPADERGHGPAAWLRRQGDCLSHFGDRFDVSVYHLVAGPASAQRALLWTTFQPDTFASLTLIDPDLKAAGPIGCWLRKNFDFFVVPTHVAWSSATRQPLPAVDPPALSSDLPADTDPMQAASAASFWDLARDFVLDHEPHYPEVGELRRILVTGGTGFLGGQTAAELQRRGYGVVAFALPGDNAVPPGVDLVEGSLDDPAAVSRAVSGVDAVIHSAAFVSDWAPYEAFERINVEGTKNILAEAHRQGIKQFVQISSLGVFGDTDQHDVDENHPLLLCSDYYSNSKAMSEVFVARFCAKHDLPYTIIRPGFIYGEGDRNFFPHLIAALEKRRVKYIGSGDNYLNAVYVGNVVELVVKSLGDARSFGERYNISDHEHVTVRRFMTDVAHGLDLPVPMKTLPKGIALGVAAIVEKIYTTLRIKKAPPLTRKRVTFLARSRRIDSSKAYAYLGSVPFSYEEGMRRTLEALKRVAS